MNATSTARDRAVTLMPWATSGWTGYTRSVRDCLVDARLAAKRGDSYGMNYWLEQAERCAERNAPTLDQKIRYREPLSQEIRESDVTYGEEWKRLSLIGFDCGDFPS